MCPRFWPPSSSPTIPTQYGFDDVTLDPPVLTDTVTINYSIDLRLVSDLVGAPVDEIEALNPSLLRMVTPPDAPFDLHLPAGTATLFEQRVALIPEARRNSWRYHPVVAGDTLASVAQEYRVTAAELAAANQLDASRQPRRRRGAGGSGCAGRRAPSRTRLYTVRRGDTLVTIADRFGVSLSQLRRWNGIPSGIRVEPGRRLHVAEPAPVQRNLDASPQDFRNRRPRRRSPPAQESSTSKQTHPRAAKKAHARQVRRRAQACQFRQDCHRISKKPPHAHSMLVFCLYLCAS